MPNSILNFKSNKFRFKSNVTLTTFVPVGSMMPQRAVFFRKGSIIKGQIIPVSPDDSSGGYVSIITQEGYNVHIPYGRRGYSPIELDSTPLEDVESKQIDEVKQTQLTTESTQLTTESKKIAGIPITYLILGAIVLVGGYFFLKSKKIV